MSAIHTETLQKQFYGTVTSLDDGESMVLDCRGLSRFGFWPGKDVQAIGTLAISATAHEFKTTTTATFTISGVTYTKAATDNLVFSANDTINVTPSAGDFWGIWLVQINAAGAVSTKSPSADQAYTTEALAIAALPSPDSSKVALGYITVEANNGAAWTANTDDMTPASDCQAANFTDTSATVSYSLVDSAEASTHIGTPATGATLGAAVVVTVSWPFYLISVSGQAGAKVAIV